MGSCARPDALWPKARSRGSKRILKIPDHRVGLEDNKVAIHQHGQFAVWVQGAKPRRLEIALVGRQMADLVWQPLMFQSELNLPSKGRPRQRIESAKSCPEPSNQAEQAKEQQGLSAKADDKRDGAEQRNAERVDRRVASRLQKYAAAAAAVSAVPNPRTCTAIASGANTTKFSVAFRWAFARRWAQSERGRTSGSGFFSAFHSPISRNRLRMIGIHITPVRPAASVV